MLLRKIKSCLSFLLRTSKVCLLVSIGAVLLLVATSDGTLSILPIIKWLLFFIPVAGIPTDYLFREFMRKDEYYFYYNLGVSKLTLWIFNIFAISVPCFILSKVIDIWI